MPPGSRILGRQSRSMKRIMYVSTPTIGLTDEEVNGSGRTSTRRMRDRVLARDIGRAIFTAMSGW